MDGAVDAANAPRRQPVAQLGPAVAEQRTTEGHPARLPFGPHPGEAIEASGKFCVNMLHENQQHVSAQFGSKAEDKFAGIDWNPSGLGSPVLDGTLAHIDCTVHSVHDGGDHFVVFGAVQSMSEPQAIKPRPLLFYRGEYTGIEPDKNTPAQWRDDLEAFLTTTTEDTWL